MPIEEIRPEEVIPGGYKQSLIKNKLNVSLKNPILMHKYEGAVDEHGKNTLRRRSSVKGE